MFLHTPANIFTVYLSIATECHAGWFVAQLPAQQRPVTLAWERPGPECGEGPTKIMRASVDAQQAGPVRRVTQASI